MTARLAYWLLIGVLGPFILLTFMVVFQDEGYQYWGDKYHAVVSAQYIFSRLPADSFIRPLWRDDVLGGNIWLVSLGTVPFMVDTVAARLFHLSPFSIDLLSNVIGYAVAAGAMYLYLRRVLALSVEGAAAGSALFVASGYLLAVWTGCPNDLLVTGLLPASLVLVHRVAGVFLAGGVTGGLLLRCIGLALLVYAGAAASSIKTLPILLLLIVGYGAFVFRSFPVLVVVSLSVTLGLILYSPWLWLYWEAAGISQRVAASFVPTASYGLEHLLGQVLVVVKRFATGFNVYGVSMPAVLVCLVAAAACRERLKQAALPIGRILQFSIMAFLLCFIMDAFSLQANDLKRGVPLFNGFDVVRFEWFASFFCLAPVAWIMDKVLFGPGAPLLDSRRFRIAGWAIAVTAVLFGVQAVHLTRRTLEVPPSIYPQNLLLDGYLFVYVMLSVLALVLAFKSLQGRREFLRGWCVSVMAVSVLFQASVIGYRHGVDQMKRNDVHEPLMTYAERFSVPDDLVLLRDMNRSADRVVDLTRPYKNVLTTAAFTALPLAGLSTPVGYINLFPRWYDRFITHVVNGNAGAPVRWVEIRPGPAANLGALKLLDVKYVLAYANMDLAGYAQVRRHEQTGKVVYEATSDVAPAFLSSDWVCAANDREALETMRAAEPAALAVRAILVSSDQTSRSLCRGSSGASAEREPAQSARAVVPARIEVRRASDRVNIEVDSQSGGLLTLADTYYPGWRAFLDGAEVPIVRTYTTLRGIQVRPGTHVVEFVFSPRVFTVLTWLSNGLLAGLLATAAWIGWRRWPFSVRTAAPEMCVHEK